MTIILPDRWPQPHASRFTLHAERIATLAAADSITQRSLDHVEAIAARLMRWTLVAVVILASIAMVGAVWVARARRVKTP